MKTKSITTSDMAASVNIEEEKVAFCCSIQEVFLKGHLTPRQAKRLAEFLEEAAVEASVVFIKI